MTPTSNHTCPNWTRGDVSNATVLHHRVQLVVEAVGADLPLAVAFVGVARPLRGQSRNACGEGSTGTTLAWVHNRPSGRR
jgi:hypothetical protein